MRKLVIVGLVVAFATAGIYYLREGGEFDTIGEEAAMDATGVVVKSSAFSDQERIPDIYTCDGSDINPPLRFDGIPREAESLGLIVDDPDAPAGTWDHWLVVNIEPDVREVEEDAVPEGGVQIKNSFGKVEYGGPCPPPGPAHRYFFRVYALESRLEPQVISSKESLLTAMEGHVIASGELVGLYSR